MVNWWLILLAVIVALLTVALVFYVVVIFTAEEDRGEAWVPKALVVLGLSFACFNVLVLPYDVANTGDNPLTSSGGTINVTVMWEIITIVIAVLCFIATPFAMAYYESWDPDQTSIWSQLRPAIITSVVLTVVFCVLLFVLWATVGRTDISYTLYVSDGPSTASIADLTTFSTTTQSAKLQIKVSLFVYLVALMAAIGWLFLFLFGGVGLAAMPITFVQLFRDRPRPITAAEYAVRKAEIAEESQRLMTVGRKIETEAESGSTGRKHQQRALAFKMQVRDLEDTYEKLEVSYRDKGGQILLSIVYLILGILFASMSIMWALQMIIWNMAKAHPLLNNMFRALDSAFALMGVLAYGFFAFYLLWAVVMGCITFGGNLILFQVYPMKLNGTLMNAFLFNSMLIMITSIAVIQFCTISFSEYAANTSVGAMFNVYVANIAGLKYIVMYFQYPLLVIGVLSVFWLLICPKRHVDEDDDD